MKDETRVIDWRSTGRRKARRQLFLHRVDFCCVGYVKDDNVIPCGKTTTVPPQDAPSWFEEIWPSVQRVLNPQSLQADHETKDLTQNDIMHLNWRCASCHKLQDSQTEKGMATVSGEDIWGNPIEGETLTELTLAQLSQLSGIKEFLGMEEEEINEPDIWGD